MRRVLYQEEVFDCLKACHEEGCGGHFRVQIIRRKVLDAELMWPSMNRDVVHWCKSCHECQVYQKRKLIPEPLKGIVSYGPFEKWGVDVIGPLPGTRNGKHYILSAVDYMTKWPKAKASRGATSKDVCNFIFDCICCRFGVPLELVSDQGKEFRNDLIEGLDIVIGAMIELAEEAKFVGVVKAAIIELFEAEGVEAERAHKEHIEDGFGRRDDDDEEENKDQEGQAKTSGHPSFDDNADDGQDQPGTSPLSGGAAIEPPQPLAPHSKPPSSPKENEPELRSATVTTGWKPVAVV
ncbi:hypothetical protein L7F22_057480 [Adiantum nelumboides]|nr:hypothetical protein [Adiantum nelumboides]